MLTSKQRAKLRGLASTEDTILQVGKGGVADAEVVQVIGGKFVLYRRNDKKPRIELD